MGKPVIAVDVDDVLASSAQGFVEFSNQRWGTHLTVEDYKEHWGQMWQVDDAEYNRRARMIYESQTVKDFTVHKDAKKTLEELSKTYTLIITTSRVKVVEKDTLDWLDRHYQGIFQEVHLGGFYDKITEESHIFTKAELCKRIGAKFLIDDHPKHCFAVAGVGIEALLYGDYPWNRNLELPKNVTRVQDWQSILEYFRARG